MNNIEFRDFPKGKMDFHEEEVEDRGRKKLRISGYAAVFNSLSVELWGFREMIKPGAFTESIKNQDDVMALINHNPDRIIGRSTAGSLILREDETGLLTEIMPPDTTDGRDVMTNLKSGLWNKMSFAFSVLPDGEKWRIDENEQYIREITKAKLYDVSVVTYPAYNDTSVGVRSFGELKECDPEAILERGKRALGLITPKRDQAIVYEKYCEREMMIA